MNTKTCPKCGEINPAHNSYCICGTSLTNVAVVIPPEVETTNLTSAEAENTSPEEAGKPVTLLLVRPQSIFGSAIKYDVFVDDNQIGVLGNGGRLEQTIPPGRHVISAGSAGSGKAISIVVPMSSITITPKGGDQVTVSCAPSTGGVSLQYTIFKQQSSTNTEDKQTASGNHSQLMCPGCGRVGEPRGMGMEIILMIGAVLVALVIGILLPPVGLMGILVFFLARKSLVKFVSNLSEVNKCPNCGKTMIPQVYVGSESRQLANEEAERKKKSHRLTWSWVITVGGALSALIGSCLFLALLTVANDPASSETPVTIGTYLFCPLPFLLIGGIATFFGIKAIRSANSDGNNIKSSTVVG